MSRPRTPYGPNPPGRLQGTMVKVLAAELSDQGRLVRGKRYWSDDAVVDIVVGHGAVTAEVQGSRPQPYVVTIEAASGTGMPSKRDLRLRCTCPDDTESGRDACKHVVAAMFALSDEISVEPELVARWRAGGRAPDPVAVTSLPAPAHDDSAHDRGDRRDDGNDADGPLAPVVPIRTEVDELARLLGAPAGAVELPEPEPIVHPRLAGGIASTVLDPVLHPVPDSVLDTLLEDALDHLQIRWES